ncbi:MAG TPA: oxidoreductase [Streptosporangiaceae bacterium]|jgi:NAD(P)-dependent dehydrogenase (short-subunit alcohol dehydrogenase family)|nr:oxidoreductase [Streptosporangiaceae bacterium]
MTQHGGSGQWTAADAGDQHGRIAVITGATSGLGLETARVLAQHGATVVLAGRDPGRTEAAARQLRAELGQGLAEAAGSPAAGAGAPAAVETDTVQTAELDLASLESVRAAAADLSGRFPRLDLLINNAGVMMPPYSLTKDGFELQFGTNHLGHFALTGLLMNSLLAAPGSRVVTVSSNGHRAGRMNFADLQSARHYQKMAAYGRSKLANLMFTYELQRRLSAAGADTIALAAHPGTARTELTRHMSGLSQGALDPRFGALNSWWVQDAKMGTLPILRAATDPAAIGGTYYGPGGFMQLTGYPVVVTSSGRSQNKEVQRRLWVESEQLTGVTYPV